MSNKNEFVKKQKLNIISHQNLKTNSPHVLNNDQFSKIIHLYSIIHNNLFLLNVKQKMFAKTFEPPI